MHGSCQEEHDSRLQEVLQRLAYYHLTLNSQKCLFGQKEIEFLGYVVTAGGLRPMHSKVGAIRRISKPNNVKELASFLGVVGYSSRFLSSYADMTEPLRQLLKKVSVWTWTSACDAAFEELKRPVLAHFSVTDKTFVTCDASGVAVGAVLSQLRDGVERPVAFASRALLEHERKYSVGEREALACIWACERWHTYMYGRPFIL